MYRDPGPDRECVRIRHDWEHQKNLCLLACHIRAVDDCLLHLLMEAEESH